MPRMPLWIAWCMLSTARDWCASHEAAGYGGRKNDIHIVHCKRSTLQPAHCPLLQLRIQGTTNVVGILQASMMCRTPWHSSCP